MTARPHHALSRRRLLTGSARLALLAALPARLRAAPAATDGFDARLLEAALDEAQNWSGLRSLQVARHGQVHVERVFRGPDLDQPVNIKSVAKSFMAALTGAAIARGVLDGVEQRVAPLLGELVPADADPRVGAITVDHLLTMRAGLERTSGPHYGRWVTSSDWVRHVLSRPFVAEPGGRMLYSTGSYHLLSAALTRASGRSTHALARDWLGAPLGIDIPRWDRDPQGFYFGGNNMALAPRALLRFGEMYRQSGAYGNHQVLPADWIERSWTPRTRSVYTGDAYGYGWFIARARGYPVYYAWGYGGQMIHVVPELALTAVVTSDPDSPSGRTGYARELHGLLADGLIPAARAGTR